MSMASQMCQIPVTCIIFCCFFGEFRRSMHVLTIPGVTDFDISWRYRVEHTLIKEKTKNVMYMCCLGVQIPCHCKAMSLLHSLFQPVHPSISAVCATPLGRPVPTSDGEECQ
jgi:hypothetical protein